MKTLQLILFFTAIVSSSFAIENTEIEKLNQNFFEYLRNPSVEKNVKLSSAISVKKLISRWEKIESNFGEFKSIHSTHIDRYKNDIQILSLVEHSDNTILKYVTSISHTGEIIGFHTYKTIVRPEKVHDHGNINSKEINEELLESLAKSSQIAHLNLSPKIDQEKLISMWNKVESEFGKFESIKSVEIVNYKTGIVVYSLVNHGENNVIKYYTYIDTDGTIQEFCTERMFVKPETIY